MPTRTIWVAVTDIHIGSAESSSFVLAYRPGNEVPAEVVTRYGWDDAGLVQIATVEDDGSSPDYTAIDPVTQGELDAVIRVLNGKAEATDERLSDKRTPLPGSVTNAEVAENANISADKIVDGVSAKVLTVAERAKLQSIADAATANATDAELRDRATHTGTQSADTLTDGTNGKVYTAAEKTKLSGVATQATKNATDAQLRDRATHTGVQTSATISDLREAVEDYVSQLLSAGTNVTLQYVDNGEAAGSLTITNNTDPEAVRDAIGIALVGAGLISVGVNDAGDTITLSTTATANSTDAQLRDRATHTGTQGIDTVSGLQAELDALVPAFADPGADRLMGWDDSASAWVPVSVSTGLTWSASNVLTVRTATATATGIVELATDAEALAGTDTTRAVTPANLKAVTNTLAPATHTHDAEDITGLTATGPDLITPLRYPLFIAHRGGPLAFPEHSLEGYRAAAESGFVIETDVQALSDGNLVCIHDATLNRTTTGTGNVSATTTATWETLQIRPAYPGRDYARPVTWQQLADEWGGHALLLPEVKAAAALTPLLDDIVRRGIQKAVIVQSFTYSDCTAAVARGINACFLSDTATPATLIADGVKYLGCSTAATTTYINAAKAAGLKVFVYTASTKAVADTQIARADGVFSDDPWMHSGRFPRQRIMPIRAGSNIIPAFGPVQLANATAHDTTANPFRQTPSGLWMDLATSAVGDGVTHAIRQTWAGVLPSTFTLRFRVTFDSTHNGDQSRWTAVYWGALPSDDAGFRDAAVAGQNGYHMLTARSGGGGFYRVASGVAAVALAPAVTTGTAVAVANAGVGGSSLIEIKVTATQVIYTNMTHGFGWTWNDTGFRGPGVLSLSWRDVSAEISDVQIIE